MTTTAKPGLRLNGHAITLAKLIAFVAAVLWFGGEVRDIKNEVRGNWTLPDQVIHDLKTEAMNPTIKIPDSAAIVEARKKVSKS